MASKYIQSIVGLLLVLIAGTVVYISFDDTARIRIDEDKSVFYIKLLEGGEPVGRWLISAQQNDRLFKGTSIIDRVTKSIERGNYTEDSLRVEYRSTTYENGEGILHTWKFDPEATQIEQFPLEEQICVYNAKGKYYRYSLDKLVDNPDKYKIDPTTNSMSFGRRMKIDFPTGYSWGWVGWPYGDDSFSLQYKIISDEECFDIRLFDPESTTQDQSGGSGTYLVAGSNKFNGAYMSLFLLNDNSGVTVNNVSIYSNSIGGANPGTPIFDVLCLELDDISNTTGTVIESVNDVIITDDVYNDFNFSCNISAGKYAGIILCNDDGNDGDCDDISGGSTSYLIYTNAGTSGTYLSKTFAVSWSNKYDPSFKISFSIPPDTTGPTYSLNQTTEPIVSTNVTHSLYWEDDTALDGYIFSWCNGTWNGTECLVSGLWDITTTTTAKKSVDVTTQETALTGVYLKPDGLRMYTTGESGDSVDEYNLSTAWDISTATYVREKSVNAQENSPTGVYFNDDGTIMYVSGESNDINQYSLSTAWDVTSATYTNLYTIVLGCPWETPGGLWFRDDGLKMYLSNSQGSCWYATEYNLSTAWNVSTAINASDINLNTFSSNSLRGISLKSDGTKMYVSNADKKVYEFTMSTPWDLSTAISTGNKTLTNVTTPKGIHMPSVGNKIYVVDAADDDIWEYDIGTGISFVNDSFVSMTGTNNWSNVTKLLQDTVGLDYAWCVSTNDSSGNLNDTSCDSPFTYTSIVGDTCTCAGLNTNWEINLGDYCVTTDACDLGTGKLSFTGTGNFTCDAQIDTTDLGDVGSGNTMFINDNCVIYVS